MTVPEAVRRRGVMYLAAATCVVVGCGRSGFEPLPDTAGDTAGDDGPGRVTNGVIALYTFEEGAGTLVRDLADGTSPLDLQLGAATSWIAGGIELSATAGATISSAPAAKITSACMASGESTIEAWVAAASTAIVGAGRIAGVASNNNVAVLSLGQEVDAYYGQIRTSTASTKLVSPLVVSTRTSHLVHTRSTAGLRRLYVDAVEVTTTTSAGALDNWDATLPVTLGNALDGGVRWQGRLFLVAFYCRELTRSEVEQNFAVGP